MDIFHHPRFTKSFNKRIKPSTSLVQQFKERWLMFRENPSNPILKDHALKGNFRSYRSFSITGDIGVIYKTGKDVILLYDVGSHNQVYK